MQQLIDNLKQANRELAKKVKQIKEETIKLEQKEQKNERNRNC